MDREVWSTKGSEKRLGITQLVQISPLSTEGTPFPEHPTFFGTRHFPFRLLALDSSHQIRYHSGFPLNGQISSEQDMSSQKVRRGTETGSRYLTGPCSIPSQPWEPGSESACPTSCHGSHVDILTPDTGKKKARHERRFGGLRHCFFFLFLITRRGFLSSGVRALKLGPQTSGWG